MYRFHDSLKPEKTDGLKGRVICGIKYLDNDLANDLLAKLECLPDKSILDSDMFALDGVFHAIRVFESGILKKEVVYDDAEEIVFNEKSNSADLKSFYSELYLKIEKIIGCGDK